MFSKVIEKLENLDHIFGEINNIYYCKGGGVGYYVSTKKYPGLFLILKLMFRNSTEGPCSLAVAG